MWIRLAKIAGFGRLVGRDVEFSQGLNCVYGPNETGKTSLMTFLVSMLYGHAKAGATRRYVDECNARYAPWSAPGYGGRIDVTLADGREVAVKRDFSGAAEGIELFDVRTGRSLLGDYKRVKTREYEFVDKEARIDKGTFENVFVVRHDSAARLDAASDGNVGDRLVALADTGREEGGAAGAQALLQAARQRIGSERALTQAYARTLAELDAAREQHKRVADARERYAADLARQSELAREAESETHALEEAEAVVRRSVTAAVAAIDAERARLKADEERLAPAGMLPAEFTAEALTRAESRADAAGKAYASAQAAHAGAAKDAEEAEKAVGALGTSARLEETRLRPAEDAVVEFVERRARLEEKLAQSAAIASRIRTIQQKWGAEYAALGEVSPADEEFLAGLGSRQDALSTEAARLRDESGASNRACAAARRIVIAASAVGGALALMAVLTGLLGQGALKLAGPICCGALACAAAAAAAVATLRARDGRRQARAVEETLAMVEGDMAALAERESEMLAQFPERQRESLLGAFREFRQDTRDTESLAREADALQAQAEKALGETREALERMQSAMAGSGLAPGQSLRRSAAQLGENAPKPESLEWSDTFTDVPGPSAARETFRSLWEKHREARAARERAEACRLQAGKAAAGLAKAQAQRDEANAALGSMLDTAQVDSVEAARRRLADRETLHETRARARELARREEAVLDGAPRESIDVHSAADGQGQRLIAEKDLPSARRKLATLKGALAERRAELSGLAGRLDEGLRNVPPMARVEERIEQLKERHRLQVMHRDALDAAIRVVTDAAGSFHEEVYPKIESRLQALVSRVTLGAHDRVSVWSDGEGATRTLRISVSDMVKDAPVDPADLSQGGAEQVYLCARLALVDALSVEETLPVMLDDPFINYDGARLRAAVEVLAEESARRQVFLFTCQEDVRDLVTAAAGHVVML